MSLYKNLHIKIICFLLIAAFYPSASFAHKVMTFGWVEGDMVNTISKFSGGKKVQKAPVSVYNKNGEFLLGGKTDEKGEFSFKLPAEKELKIVLEASMGHKTSCVVEVNPPVGEPHVEHINTPNQEGGSTEGLLDSKEIAAVVENVLDKKMAVVLRMIAEKEEKQSVTEIISGIGYILGLIGIALWIRNR